MGKLTSLITGTLAVEVISYYVASSYYSQVINWIGPVFGFKLVMMLGYLYVFFADPARNLNLIPIWSAVGLLVALGSRRGLRSTASAVSVFMTSLGVFGMILYAFLLPLTGGGASSGQAISAISFPPAPPGSSFSQILHEPVINAFLTLVGPFVSGRGGSSPLNGGLSGSVAQSYIYPLARNMAGNLAILLVSSALFGTILSRIPGRRRGGRKGRTVISVTIIAFLILTATGSAIASSHLSSEGHVMQVQNEVSNEQVLKYFQDSASYFNATLQDGLKVSLSSQISAQDRVFLNTSVAENGQSSAYGVIVNESSLITDYGNYMLNSTGSPGITARTVKPGGTGQSTFSFTPGGVGEYVIRNITVRYSENISGSASNISTIHPFVIHVPPPQFLYAFNRVEATSLSALGKSVGFPYLAAEIMPGIYVFDLLAALVVGTDIMIEVRTFRSYRSGRN